ncbi:MAG: hypothetical protein Q8934_06925 [Bacillota bacterium]|nr:hypothetical protein [Bacillota bacterium]
MNGIYYINENIALDGKPKEKSIQIQKNTVLQYLEEKQIEIVKLNPIQLYEYYTIPHALLYDLKKYGTLIDCLFLYSSETMEPFINIYPARWLLIKSFFNQVVTIKNKDLL